MSAEITDGGTFHHFNCQNCVLHYGCTFFFIYWGPVRRSSCQTVKLSAFITNLGGLISGICILDMVIMQIGCRGLDCILLHFCLLPYLYGRRISEKAVKMRSLIAIYTFDIFVSVAGLSSWPIGFAISQ